MFDAPERLAPRFSPRRARRSRPHLLSLLLRDRLLLALLIPALIINLGLLAYLALRLDGLNDLLPLHFDAQGFPDRIDSKTGVLSLPLIGFVVIAVNTLIASLGRSRERAASVLLASSAMLVQVLLWLAAANIVGGLI